MGIRSEREGRGKEWEDEKGRSREERKGKGGNGKKMV